MLFEEIRQCIQKPHFFFGLPGQPAVDFFLKYEKSYAIIKIS